MFTSQEYSEKLTHASEHISDSERVKTVGLLEHRKIDHLLHFTDSNNLVSILDKGILSRDQLVQQGISFIASDSKRLDYLTNAISLSIAYPNRKMLYLKKILDQKRVFLVLEVSLNILYEKSSRYICMPGNAARHELKNHAWLFPKLYVGYQGAIRMFPPRQFRDKKSFPSNLPLDIQAEILFFDDIPPNRIQKIHCEGLLQENKPEVAKILAENYPLIPICNYCKDRAFLQFADKTKYQEEFKLEKESFDGK